MNTEKLLKRAAAHKQQGRYDAAAQCYVDAARACIDCQNPAAADFFSMAANAYSYEALNGTPVVHRSAMRAMKEAFDAAIHVHVSVENGPCAAQQAAIAGSTFYTMHRNAIELNEAIVYYSLATALYRNCGLHMHANTALSNVAYLQSLPPSPTSQKQ